LERGNCAARSRQDRGDESANYRENTRLLSGGAGPIRGFDMVLNNFSRRIFASTAAARDRQLQLYLVQRSGTAIHDFTDLAIADGIAQANVHGA
jgi:hypothetical protein